MRSNHDSIFSGFSRTVLSAAVAIVVAAPAFAQNTTAAIGGRITSPDGKPVAGATVSILHRESGSANHLTTDAEGRYAARGLRVGGPYTITVTKGSDKETRDEVFLQLAEAQSLDLTLGGATLAAVVVTGSANNKFNAASMGAGTNIGRKELDTFASLGRNLQDYARTDPRLSQTDKERGEISAGGQNSRYNSITIDGVRTNDTFGLEANNLPTTKQPVSVDAIQSVQVNISNYDVTQQGYTGANINAVTKSGTNSLKGSVYYVYRDDTTGGQRFNKANNTYFPFLSFKEDTKGFTLGGPIIEDKLFFFASYEELKSNRAQPEFGPVGSALTNVAISQSAIDSLKSIAKTKYNFDAGDVTGATTLLAKDTLLKIDWNINENHRANVRFARTEQSDTNNGSFSSFSATGLQMTSQWWDQNKVIDTMVGQWFADWTPTFSTELKLSNRNYNSVPQNYSNLPAMGLQFNNAAPAGAPAGVNIGSRFLNFGTEQSRQYNTLDTKTFDGYFGATWTLNAHELKFGGDMNTNKVYNAFFQNTKGNYTFSCVNSSATYTYSFGTINCATATAAQNEAAVLENFSRGRPFSYQVQVPIGSSLDVGAANWTLQDTGVFLQDTWTASNKLTITAGVRLDHLSTNDKPTANPDAAKAPVAGSVNGNTVVRNTGGFGMDNSGNVDGQELAQPRFGFNYTLDSADKRKAQVRGGFGLFQGAAANVWLTNPYSNTGMATRIIGCGTSGFAACPGTGAGIFSADPNGQLTTLPGTTPAANVDYIEKGLGQPSVWKMNLAYDAELPWGGLVVGAEWLGTKTKTAIYYQHLNLGAPTKTGPDGRELYYTPQAYSTACWTTSGSTITTGACTGLRAKGLSNASFNNVLQATQTSEGGGNAIALTLTGPKVAGIEWNLAYTRTDATEASPLTSSVANSNFNSRSIFNANENVAANSAYLTKDRVNASLNWSKALVGKFKTTVGLFYEGRSGKPYSWTYANDLNGDGVSGNDLMYIPKGPQSGEVVFAGDTATNHPNEDRFWAIVESHAELREAKGGVVKRNGSFSPIVHNFDMRISQEVPGFQPKHKGVFSLDIFNVGNLINKQYGVIDEVAFQSAGGARRTFVNYGGIDASGKYVYNVRSSEDSTTVRQVKGESQWALQITARYEF